MNKKTTNPSESQLEDYIDQCRSATSALCQKQMDEWSRIYQSHERHIASKRNELVGYFGLDVAQQKLGQFRHQQEHPTILQRLNSAKEIARRIDEQEKRIAIIEAKIERELELDKHELYVSLQVQEHVDSQAAHELAQSLKRWHPDRGLAQDRHRNAAVRADSFVNSRDSDERER